MKNILILLGLMATSNAIAGSLAVECTVNFVSPGLMISTAVKNIDSVSLGGDQTHFERYSALNVLSAASYTKGGAISQLVQKCVDSSMRTGSDYQRYSYTLAQVGVTAEFIADDSDRGYNNALICSRYVQSHAKCAVQPGSLHQLPNP